LAETVKEYDSFSPAASIDPLIVCPQSIAVWAKAIKGNRMITPEIILRVINR
jgi:hypothetical protein